MQITNGLRRTSNKNDITTMFTSDQLIQLRKVLLDPYKKKTNDKLVLIIKKINSIVTIIHNNYKTRNSLSPNNISHMPTDLSKMIQDNDIINNHHQTELTTSLNMGNSEYESSLELSKYNNGLHNKNIKIIAPTSCGLPTVMTGRDNEREITPLPPLDGQKVANTTYFDNNIVTSQKYVEEEKYNSQVDV